MISWTRGPVAGQTLFLTRDGGQIRLNAEGYEATVAQYPTDLINCYGRFLTEAGWTIEVRTDGPDGGAYFYSKLSAHVSLEFRRSTSGYAIELDYTVPSSSR